MHEFGEVDGENLDLLDVENKKKALKWMVDKSIEEFNKRNYAHIDLGGFYWFYESIAMKPEEHNEEFLRYITDYIRSLGYKWQILLREALKLLMIIMPKVQRQVG